MLIEIKLRYKEGTSSDLSFWNYSTFLDFYKDFQSDEETLDLSKYENKGNLLNLIKKDEIKEMKVWEERGEETRTPTMLEVLFGKKKLFFSSGDYDFQLALEDPLGWDELCLYLINGIDVGLWLKIRSSKIANYNIKDVPAALKEDTDFLIRQYQAVIKEDSNA